jgi:hypothetical protein
MPITITVQRTMPASAAAAFALTIDPARFPFPGYGPIAAIGKVVLDAPLAVGSLRRIHNADGTVLTERVTVLEPPRRHAYELSGFTAPFSWLVRLGEAEWRVEPVDGGAAVTWRYRFTLTSFLAYPVAAVLLAVFMRGAMNRCLAAMAAILAADGTR